MINNPQYLQQYSIQTLERVYKHYYFIIRGYDLYYWEANGKAELNFEIQSAEGDIIPVEVKAADNVRAKSLGVFMKKYDIQKAIRISSKNFGFENHIKSVPLYAAFAINE